jgi:hypothetical protein
MNGLFVRIITVAFAAMLAAGAASAQEYREGNISHGAARWASL